MAFTPKPVVQVVLVLASTKHHISSKLNRLHQQLKYNGVIIVLLLLIND